MQYYKFNKDGNCNEIYILSNVHPNMVLFAPRDIFMACLKKSYDGILGEQLFFIPPLNPDATVIMDQYKIALPKGSKLVQPFNYM